MPQITRSEEAKDALMVYKAHAGRLNYTKVGGLPP